MALIKCSECGKEVSSSAKTCPHCGIKINFKKCPECGNEIQMAEGCFICLNCGYSGCS